MTRTALWPPNPNELETTGPGVQSSGSRTIAGQWDLGVLFGQSDVGRQLVALDRQDGRGGLDGAAGSEGMTRRSLDRRHRRLVVSENAGDDVALRSGR